MRNQKMLQQGLGMMLLFVIALSLVGCGRQQSEHTGEAPAERSATTDPKDIWVDKTNSTIGTTYGYTNRAELADINGDDLVDILFANGGLYETPGKPDFSKVFLNQGPDQSFEGASRQVLPKAMLARVIKVRDVSADGSPDILVGTTFQTQSQLYLGDGSGDFTDETSTHLPQIKASIGDLEFGDVDGDGDLDVVLADWGKESPMSNEGGRTMLWLNDGTGHFTNATQARMPEVLVGFSWELELVDIDNDYDLDIMVSCKICDGSYLFGNDGKGAFTDVTTKQRLPQFANNYDFEAMDVNGDEYLDVVTIKDGSAYEEHLFINDRQGGFRNETSMLWPYSQNPSSDDNMAEFLDFDSDGDADVLIGLLDDLLGDPDRLLLNDGTGKLKLVNHTEPILGVTAGTLDIALADLDDDRKLDAVQAQGEAAASFKEKVFLGNKIQPDTAPPVITQVENVSVPRVDQPVQIRARVHDNKSPTMPHDWRKGVLPWSADGQTQETSMQWYGEYLWRGKIEEAPAGEFKYQVCATDAAGNKACAAPPGLWQRLWRFLEQSIHKFA
jgi:FG-GAP-like repeat